VRQSEAQRDSTPRHYRLRGSDESNRWRLGSISATGQLLPSQLTVHCSCSILVSRTFLFDVVPPSATSRGRAIAQGGPVAFDFDVIILGSGFGATVAALDQNAKGKSIMILERGVWWLTPELTAENPMNPFLKARPKTQPVKYWPRPDLHWRIFDTDESMERSGCWTGAGPAEAGQLVRAGHSISHGDMLEMAQGENGNLLN
jgi:hypothetical protein